MHESIPFLGIVTTCTPLNCPFVMAALRFHWRSHDTWKFIQFQFMHSVSLCSIPSLPFYVYCLIPTTLSMNNLEAWRCCTLHVRSKILFRRTLGKKLSTFLRDLRIMAMQSEYSPRFPAGLLAEDLYTWWLNDQEVGMAGLPPVLEILVAPVQDFT